MGFPAVAVSVLALIPIKVPRRPHRVTLRIIPALVRADSAVDASTAGSPVQTEPNWNHGAGSEFVPITGFNGKSPI